MKKIICVFCLILFVLTSSCDNNNDKGSTPCPTPLPIANEHSILVGGRLVGGTGCDIGIDDSQELRNWLSTSADSLKMQYPGGLGWAALFITICGSAVDQSRPAQDFSQYTRLAIEMKGESGGECVQVGMKDANDPDDGSETKQSVQLTADWNTYEFNLSDFITCQLNQVYVVTEFVFPCSGQNEAQTVDVRTIRFFK